MTCSGVCYVGSGCYRDIFSCCICNEIKMCENTLMTFDGFLPDITSLPHQDETVANWADLLVDEIFNDPDYKQLQVVSIINAIKEEGFPIEYANKVHDLEKLLDPRNEGVAVDKPTLRKVARLWLISCREEINTNGTSTVDVDRSTDVHHDIQASIRVNVPQNKDGSYKNELYDLNMKLNGCEDKIKILQLDNDVLQKLLQKLQVALQEADKNKVLAEESNAIIEEALKIEKSGRREEVSELVKQLALTKHQVEILTKENDYLCERNLADTVNIERLQDELKVKFSEKEILDHENDTLKICCEDLDNKLKLAEEEINQLRCTNFDLVEHGEGWKKTIQSMQKEKDHLTRRLLVFSSRIKRGKKDCISEPDTTLPRANLKHSSCAGVKTEVIPNISDDTGIGNNCINKSSEVPNTLECQEANVKNCKGEGQAIDRNDFVATKLPENVKLLCNRDTETIVSPSSSTANFSLAPDSDLVNNEMQQANFGTNEEIQSIQCISTDPSFDLRPDLKTPDSLPSDKIVTPDKEHTDPVVKIQVPASECYTFTRLIVKLIVSTFLLLFLFSLLILLARAVLSEKDYISYLLALGGKYYANFY